MNIGKEFETAMTERKKRVHIVHRHRDAFPLQIGSFTRIHAGEYSEMHMIERGQMATIDKAGNVDLLGEVIPCDEQMQEYIARLSGFVNHEQFREWLKSQMLISSDPVPAWFIVWL